MRLSNSGLDRFGRHVAAGEAGAAGGDDHVDIAGPRSRPYLCRIARDVVRTMAPPASTWPARVTRSANSLAGGVALLVAGVGDGQDGDPQRAEQRSSSTSLPPAWKLQTPRLTPASFPACYAAHSPRRRGSTQRAPAGPFPSSTTARGLEIVHQVVADASNASRRCAAAPPPARSPRRADRSYAMDHQHVGQPKR